MTGAQIVARARRWVGDKKLSYKLGRGNYYPERGEPCLSDLQCDCSGYVAHVLQYKRGNWNTDAVLRDANGKQEKFYRPLDVQPGDLVVFGGVFERLPVLRRIKPGHIGIVVDTSGIFGQWAGSVDNWRALRTVHCSMGNQKRFGYPVAETDSSLWAKRGIVVRPVFRDLRA